MGSIRMLIICFVLVAIAATKAANMKKRLTLAESYLNTLELKTDLAVDSIEANSRMLVELNRTVAELEYCVASEKGAPLETADKIRHALIDDTSKDRHSKAVLRAFEQEKTYVRKEVRRISEAIVDFEETIIQSNQSTVFELKAFRTEMNEALMLTEERHRGELDNLTSEIIRLKQSAALMKESFQIEMTEVLSLAEERLRGEIESLKKSHDIELSELKAWVLNTRRDVYAPEVDSLKSCPRTWTKYQTFCYKFFDKVFYNTYEEAKQHCSSHGAYVVDIQHEEENDFIKSFVGQDVWIHIGLQHQSSDGTWVWERTGKEAIYTDWRLDKPNGEGTCVIADSKGLWFNTPCDHRFFLKRVCKKKV